jgi:hypothetical protein
MRIRASLHGIGIEVSTRILLMIAKICTAEKRELMAHPAKIYLASDAWV